jgi:hypothetical protein
MTIRRAVIERVEEDHGTLACIVRPRAPGWMAEVVELAADQWVTGDKTYRWRLVSSRAP